MITSQFEIENPKVLIGRRAAVKIRWRGAPDTCPAPTLLNHRAGRGWDNDGQAAMEGGGSHSRCDQATVAGGSFLGPIFAARLGVSRASDPSCSFEGY